MSAPQTGATHSGRELLPKALPALLTATMKRLKPMTSVFANYEPIRIGVSSCLLGANVRFDGGHKRNDFLVETFGEFVEFVPVCPEVEIGLGVPRETLNLVRRPDKAPGVRLVGNTTGIDFSDRMNSYADRRITALEVQEICGYVLKKNSPSCGKERVHVYGTFGTQTADGTGLFAAALMRVCPSLPVEEEARLTDPHLRENFIERVFAYRRLRSFFSSRWSLRRLLNFHTANRLVLITHSPKAYRELCRLVDNANQMSLDEIRVTYEIAFMEALKKPATTSRHVKVLRYLLGQVRRYLNPDSREELVALIEEYRRGLAPLVVPISRFRHHARRFHIGPLHGQLYLEPRPDELMLHEHVWRTESYRHS